MVGPRTRGKVDGKKLDELNVPRNSLRGKLSRGETIQFEVKGPSGSEMRTVRPEDCVGLSEPPAVVIILDVPMIEMIPSVIHSFDSAYKPFRSIDPSDMEKHTVRVVYHLLGEGVLQDERYIDFMKGFPATTEVIANLRLLIDLLSRRRRIIARRIVFRIQSKSPYVHQSRLQTILPFSA